ncbi:MAG: dTDP-4-dehydrorhamnose 3,5-epimerase [Muribaculaceae bacterium]|nr:dTDP-4-dehydrorhamnose 3,5-epimerase [Muribaculaceae bacterium]
MQYIEQNVKGVYVIEPVRYGDQRGYFCECFKKEEFQANVGNVEFIQDNESFSSYGVLRGLHFQAGEFSQAKLVRVSQGKVLDVAVDLRKDSSTFGQYVAVELTAENAKMLFIPRGFAHGFVVLSEVAQFQYKVDNVYAPQSEHTLSFNDPSVAVDWKIDTTEMLLSPKDMQGLSLNYIKENII